jgi:hypothetical protein
MRNRTFHRTAIIATLGALLLVGCGEQEAALLAKPEVIYIGQFDGCDVKYINRGYQINSFYLASCVGATTTTMQYTEKSGKSTNYRTITTINKEINSLEAEKRAMEAREAALNKLTPEERNALLGGKDQ